MKINRETLLSDLHMVRAGLSPREFIEQSSCFVFQGGQVMTFNDEVACRKEMGLKGVEGAVQAQSLLAILEKLEDPELTVVENDANELEFQGKRKSFGLVKDAEIFLPIDRVEIPEKWHKLPEGFTAAIEKVQHCVSTDESKFFLTCIHIHPEYIEACDNLQIMRYKVETGIKHSTLVRGTSLTHITQLGMEQVALTKSWIHFKNKPGLIFSCRRYSEDYPSLDKMIEFEGDEMVLPKGLAMSSERAAIFATDKSGDPHMSVTLRPGKIKLVGRGLSGWYREVKKCTYQGPPMEFVIAPDLLKHISEKYNEASLEERRLKVVGENWEYITVLGRPKDETEEETEEPAED